MGKAKGKTRQDRRLVGMSQPAEPTFVPYRDPQGDQSREFDLMDFRVWLGQWFDKGQLTDFCFILSMEHDDEWVELVRIDCCHGEAHVHRFDSAGNDDRKVIKKIMHHEDLQLAHSEAEKMIYDQTDLAQRRWHNGI